MMVEGEAGRGHPGARPSARGPHHSTGPQDSGVTRAARWHAGRPQLALFAKLPVAGEVKTRLVPPLTHEQAARLAASFLEDVAATLEQVPDVERTLYLAPHPDRRACERLLPHWRQARQVEGDLGRRLETALGEMHGLGAPAVVVGSDHPELPAERVAEAFRALARADVVLGPTPDGGYCLVGTRTHSPGLFQAVEWSTARVAEQTEARARALGLSLIRLGETSDVDTPGDLERLRVRLEKHPERALRTARTLRALPG